MTSRFPFRTTPRRAAMAGLFGAVVLSGGTGFAYAATTDVVETGYLTVVDEGSATTSPAVADGDCPDTSVGGGAR